MNRNTITELGKLHQGDRFSYVKRADVWQVIDTKGSKVAVNQINAATGERIHKYDDLKKPETTVRFLRHTQPLPHEECYVSDLQPGDVFYNNDMIVMEWEVVKPDYPRVHVRNANAPAMTALLDWHTWVTFVRKHEEVEP